MRITAIMLTTATTKTISNKNVIEIYLNNFDNQKGTVQKS